MSSTRFMLRMKIWIKIMNHQVIHRVQTVMKNYLIRLKILMKITYKIMMMKVHSMQIS
jgi:hypothetical protein